MVGWLSSGAIARVGGLALRRIPWRQAPYLGALAAIAVYVSWKLMHNQDSSEGEEKPDFASADDSEVFDADEKLDSALQPKVPDRKLELSTTVILNSEDLPDNGAPFLEENQARNDPFPGSVAVPNGTISGNQIEILPPNVNHGADEQNADKVKYVTVDLQSFGGSDDLNSENHLDDTSIVSIEAEPLEAIVSPSEALMSNSDRLDSYEFGGNVQSTHVVQDIKGLREDPEIADTQVDKNVDTMNKSASDAKNVMVKDSAIFTFKTRKSNWLFPKVDSNILAGQKRKTPERPTRPITSAGKNFEDEISLVQEGYKADDNGKSDTPQCVSPVIQADESNSSFSLSDSQNWKPVLVDVSTESTEHSAQRAKHCDGEKSSLSNDQETVKGSIRNIRTNSSNTLNSNDAAESSGSRDPDCSANTSRDSVYDQDSDDEHVVQSPSPMKHNLVEKDGEGIDPPRLEYAERLRSYDEYLADPELSPTMRSQVLRARASIAMYFDDSSDNQ